MHTLATVKVALWMTLMYIRCINGSMNTRKKYMVDTGSNYWNHNVFNKIQINSNSEHVKALEAKTGKLIYPGV